MPGAWEQRQPTVLACVMHAETTTVAWACSLRKLQPHHMPVVPLAGMPFDHCRNQMCMLALEHGFDYLFMLDSDVTPPEDCVPRLLAHKLPIVSGVYHRRSPPEGVPVMMRPLGHWLVNYPKNKLIDVDVVGAGCLLIHRSVLQEFKALAPGHHWFWWTSDMRGLLPQDHCLSEDFSFCRGAREQGWKVMVDTSIQCGHIGNAKATRGQFQPLVA